MLQAHDRLVMGQLHANTNQNGKSFISNSTSAFTFAGKSKDAIFEDFICDLFDSKFIQGDLLGSRSLFLLKSENKENNQSRHHQNNQTLPLDQTILISTAKKQNMQMLLNNLSSSDSESKGLISIDEIRNAALKLSGGDIHSSAAVGRLQIGNMFNSINQTGIAPLKLDFTEGL